MKHVYDDLPLAELATLESRRSLPGSYDHDFPTGHEQTSRYERSLAQLGEIETVEPDKQEVLSSRRTVRWKIPWRLLIVIALLLTGYFLYRGFSSPSSAVYTVEENPAQLNLSTSEAPAEQVKKANIFVHVVGAVNSPGLYELEADSRVNDAISLAGGVTEFADLTQLNLAATLDDGLQLYVPAVGESAPAELAQVGKTGLGSTASAGLINLNSASLEELQSLPRVGPVLAQKIIDWREINGGFKSVDELDAVPGIGATMLENLAPLVTV